MQILLLASTSLEISPLLRQCRDHGPDYLTRHNLDFLVSGVGLLASAYAIQKQIQLKRPDLIIQAGVAGSFEASRPRGSVWVVSDDRMADQGVREKNGFQDIFEMGLAKPGQFPYKQGKLPNPHKELIRKTGLKKVSAVTVNQITSGQPASRMIRQKYNASLESMEGAALHYTCLMEQVPFLQIRAVSNMVGVRDKKKWDLRGAIENLNISLLDILTRI